MKKTLSLVAIATLALSTIFMTSCKKKDNHVAVESVALHETTVTTLNVYAVVDPMTLQLGATVLPENASDPSLLWESSNPNIASVSETGVVTAKSAGQVTISVFCKDNYDKFDAITLTITRGDHPKWGAITFLTSDTVIISKDGKTQIWSDVVMVENVDATYAPYAPGDTIFAASIIENPGYGNMFSWQAVNDYGSALCPYPWRIPSREDFVELDQLLGGTGSGATPSELVDVYINTWKATYGGQVTTTGQFADQGTNAVYWSNTENEASTIEHGLLTSAIMLNVTNNPGASGMQWTLAPNQDLGETPPSTTACGCAPGSLTIAPGAAAGLPDDTRWYCGMWVENLGALISHTPRGSNSKANGFMVRCVK